MTNGALVDQFGRTAVDLRVSLTDRCNLRCTYCMPADGLDWLPSPDVLTNAELLRLIRIAVTRLGITDVRFTGGGPVRGKGRDGGENGGAAPCPRPPGPPTTHPARP